MENLDIINSYADFSEKSITDRFFKHADLHDIIDQLPPSFEVSIAGHSKEGRSIRLIKWGNGPTRVLLWSQMHGDEATGTMALMDLCSYLSKNIGQDNEYLAGKCTLYFLPMVNPDGAERFTRRNALQIDINRDFLQLASPEAKILKQLRDEINPEFGFNLHDQNTLWSVSKTGSPATLSFLAPAFNEQLSVDQVREKSMLVIADIFKELNTYLPNKIGLFDDEYEPRAFGDNFQASGTSTILIEAGGLQGDEEKQEIRKYYFLAILKGLQSISTSSFTKQNIKNYWLIPKNSKEIFHILIHDVVMNGVQVSLGLNAEETYRNEPRTRGEKSTIKKYYIEDIGDLSYCNAYEVFQGAGLFLNGSVYFDELAHFELLKDDKIILSFSDGIRNRDNQ